MFKDFYHGSIINETTNPFSVEREEGKESNKLKKAHEATTMTTQNNSLFSCHTYLYFFTHNMPCLTNNWTHL